MESNKEAGRLILMDLKLFDQTVRLFEQELEPDIRMAFSDAIRSWAGDRDENWTCHVDFDSITDYRLAPPQWCFTKTGHKGKESLSANPWFRLNYVGETDSLELADLCNVGSTTISLWFFIDDVRLDKLGFASRKTWNESLGKLTQKYAPRLQAFDLQLVYEKDVPCFHIPLILDPGKIADAWVNNSYSELFEPLICALNKLEKSVPIFDEMMKEMRQ